ncbi:MAG: hypothetical protein KAQ85_10130, partial [Thermodesulfovibrionia bacterium]|nr:hypothetical protein [Thermodesulfovibrionia bacterium]
MRKKAKDAVIFSMMKEKGLDFTSLHNKIRKECSENFSYHSVYKAVQQLLEEKVVIKDNKKYYICDEWAKEKITFCEKLRDHLSHVNSFADIPSIIQFGDIRSLHKFLRRLEEDHLAIFNKEKKGTVTWVVYHCYNYLLQPAKELFYVNKLRECNIDFNVLCYGNTPLDKWTRKAFEKFGANMKVNTNVGGITEMNVYDDLAVQIFYGNEFLEVLN